ncbi:hypothetical protein CH367_00870 [Leptospira barantonii]|uniref:Uncharacterized protein n=1 Tax=Leptospira barantonii TaxID=2023184 RepID=A0ABX4NRZ0_9LEPT|nr:hypothetical protein CH367_00870 [Leptospira barantonii]
MSKLNSSDGSGHPAWIADSRIFISGTASKSVLEPGFRSSCMQDSKRILYRQEGTKFKTYADA